MQHRVHLRTLTVFGLFVGLHAQSVFAAAVVRHFPITADTSLDLQGNPGSLGAAVGSLHNVLSDVADFDLRSSTGTEPIFVEGRRGGEDLAVYFDGSFQNPDAAPGNDNPATQLRGKNFCTFCPDADVREVLEELTDGEYYSTGLRALQLWVKPDPVGLGLDQVVIKDGGGQWGGVGITASGNWAHIWSRAGSVGFADTGIAVAFDRWTNVAQFSGIWGPGWLFINGSYADRRGTSYGGSGTPLTIGVDTNGFSRPFIGAVDDVKLMLAGVLGGGLVPENDLDFFEGIVFSGVEGDINQDSVVDELDYWIWSDNVGYNNGLDLSEVISLHFGDAGTLLRGDADQNGIVDFADLAIIKAAAQQAGTPIPEPASLMLVGLGALAIGRARHYRTP